MQNDYEILGLNIDATQDEAKRAYFKLVRQFSPEKDPEHFQKIRGAYERILAAATGKKDEELNFEMPDNPDAIFVIKAIRTLIHNEDYKKASNMAEHAINDFGESELLLSLLAYSQRMSGSSGKAVKTYEKLVKKYPKQNIHKRNLALAYYERGFGKKAFTAFEKAYALGFRDCDFILQFSTCCRDRNNYSRGVEILLELVRSFDNTKEAKEHIDDYIEAYMELLTMNIFIINSHFDEIVKLYLEFTKSIGRLIKKYDDETFEILLAIIMTASEEDDDCNCINYIEEIFNETKKYLPKEKYSDQWYVITNKLIEVKMEVNSHLSVEFQWCFEAFILAYKIYDDTIIRFAQTDCKLLIIERMPEIKEEFDIVKNEYPELYTAMEDFFKQLEREDISYIKEKLLKYYNKAEKYMNGGHYYELYPQERRNAEKLQWNSEEDGSFIRSGKKIGRNDPCPCGSGKKYKQCCGRNKN